jgi:hypothetical protein
LSKPRQFQKDVVTFLLESPSFYLKTLGPFSQVIDRSCVDQNGLLGGSMIEYQKNHPIQQFAIVFPQSMKHKKICKKNVGE